MSASDFTATLRQLKLALENGSPVNLRINAAGSRLTVLPRTQPHSDRWAAQAKREKHERVLRAIASAAAHAGQLRLARRAQAISVPTCTPRHHRHLVRHYGGLFNGSEADSVVFFSQDHHTRRLVERRRRALAELQRLALVTRQAQPRCYRHHSATHARNWQPRPQPTACPSRRRRNGPSMHLAPPLAATPVPQTELLDSPASVIALASKADHAESDAASAASTVNLLAALLTLVRYVRSTLPGRPRYTRTLPVDRHTQALESAAPGRWPRTCPTMGRWSCAPRDCRQVRSSLRLHHGSTDGTGTRPSFEPR